MEIIVLRDQKKQKKRNPRNIWEAFRYGNVSRVILQTKAEKYIGAKYKPQKRGWLVDKH